ncbi:hypothetical protein CU098_004490 [Rhizopus stolonifer]|uniref:3-oxo-5-alpha-steroid 4-dehydrogenase C-terminal domain-containing protein n=1 Tax=Rhizopus stolonifer TaxID=4846 RepID=A0A367J1B8_RHIST|nr:hypothetical protein CU098_004490 [Rhizopus stolonifer]
MMYIPDWTLFNTCTALAITVGSALLIVRELFPNTRLRYSKFSTKLYRKESTISSQFGMLLAYVPSLMITGVFVLVSFKTGSRLKLISCLSFVHYAKRVLEVLFVHRYSGHAKLMDNYVISISYALFACFLYVFTAQVPTTHQTLSWLGILLFIVGESMNLYHHLILRHLRKPGQKDYKIPNGAFFDYIWCPHYTCEIVSFIGLVLVTQHVLILLLQIGSAGYLVVRAYNTKQWYLQKFGSVPRRACLVPCVF